MSSPFDTFRKHRTYWMAGMVLLAILAFIVAPGIDSVMDMMRNSSAPGNEVVVRWAGGKITTGTLNYVRMQHARTQRFLQSLAREVIKAGGMPKVPGFQYNPTQKQIESIGLQMMETNLAVCRIMILGERAKQIGIELDDKVIEDYFIRFCDHKINSQRFEEILRDATGRELTRQELYRELSLELSATIMERLALAGVNYEGSPLITPGSLWQNYLRLNQAARVEAYPVLTRDFVSEVKQEPSDGELRTLYELGSNNFPSPNSPEPGFRRRYQANIEYVYGSWNKLMEVEKAKITDEQLKAEYERLVKLGGLQVPVDPPKLPGEDSAPGAAKPDDAPPPAPGDDAPATSDKPADAKPAEPSADSKPANEKPADEKPAADKPAEEKPAEEKPAEEKPAAEKPADPKSQSRTPTAATNVRLVSMQQNDGPPPVADPPAPQSTEAQPAAAADTKPADTKPADAQPAVTQPADAKPAEAVPAVGAQPAAPATDPATGALPTTPATPSAPAASPPMRTQTFEEAKESLSRQLAMNVVRDLLQTKLGKIEAAMQKYASELQRDLTSEQAGMKVEKTAKPIKLKELAEAEGLSYGETGMSDGFRLATTPIGRSMVENQSLVNLIMSPNVELFTPRRSMFVEMTSPTEPDFQEFVSWKTKDAPAYLPELSAIRDEVKEAWKTQKARNLAKEEAEKLADKLRKAGDDPFKSVLDAQQQTLVLNPTPFTWMTASNEMFAPPQISFVQGLDTVGQEFMQRVFSIPAGQITVAPNMGMNTYYVTRVVELTPTMDQLHQNFELSRGRARVLAFPERERMFADWYENIERKLGVQWVAGEDTLMN